MRVWIHIGTAKTGSTSIQHFFSRNRDVLREYGILYPKTLGEVNHLAAPVYLGAPAAFAERHFPQLARCGAREAFARGLEEALRAEIADAAPRIVVISNEHLFQFVRDAEAAAGFADLFGVGLDRLSAIVYLRRQDRLAPSLYGETLRMGSCASFASFIGEKRTRLVLDFVGGVSPWLDALGARSVSVRLFESERLPDSGVVGDLLSTVIPDAAPEILARFPDAGRRVRTSLDVEALALLLRLNTLCRDLAARPETRAPLPPPSYLDLDLRKRLASALERPTYAETASLVCGRREARRIMRQYRVGNAALFERLGMRGFDDSIGGPAQGVDAQLAALARNGDSLLRRAMPLLAGFEANAARSTP